jgi:PAS domain S-box-containing protein
MTLETFFNLLHPEDLPLLQEAITSFQAKGITAILDTQYRMKNKDGSWTWLRNRSSLEFDKDQKPLTWLGSVFDVSAIKESENKALQHIDHLHAIVNSLSDIVFEIDQTYTLLNVWAPLSHPQHELIKSFQGQKIYDVYSERKFQLFKNLIDSTLESQAPQSFTYHSFKSDQHFLARSTPLTKESTKNGKITMIIQDITENHRTQNQLKKNEANLNAIIQNTSDVFWAIDQEERLIVFNKSFEELILKISGKRPVVGNNLDDGFLLEETAKRWRHIHARSLEGLDTNFSKTLHFTEGTNRLYEFHINPYRNEKGEIIGSVVTGRDIHELYSAKKQAEKASRLKSKFVSTISHEIRTPLNAILGTCHQLVKVNQQDNLIDDIEILQLASDNLLSLINDVLDFTKLESGKTILKSTEINFPDFLRAISQFQKRLATGKGLNYSHTQIGDVPNFITSDKTKLHQVLTNVISNAIKYTDSGNISFKVISTPISEENVELKFVISDTGMGIPKKEIEGIFDSFTQSSTSYNMLKGGTGLGLAITKNLVKLLGGTIEVTSQLDKGSTFTLHFPMKMAHQQKETLNMPAKNRTFQGIKVLVAEDNEINAKIITRLLKQWNIEYDLASNGHQALEMAIEKKYNLILMDIQMPVMNGFDSSLQIKTLETSKNVLTPIVALTAQPDFSYDPSYQDGIFTSSILKPFHPESLKASIFQQISVAS